LADLVRFLAVRGEFGAAVDPAAELHRFTENTGRHYSYERTRPDGRVLEVHHNPVPDGGFVVIFSDITARKRAEEAIREARDATSIRSRSTASVPTTSSRACWSTRAG
jgi:hypothetical protein